MKNKKLYAVAFLVFSSFAALYAKEHEYHLSVEPYLDCLWGVQEEYVLVDNTSNADGVLSYLEWEEKPVWIYGYRARFCRDGFAAQLQMASAIPRECGTMYDSDWLNYDSKKTNYSESDNNLDSYFQASLKLCYDFKLGDYFTLGPAVEAGYRSIKFTAENLESWYGDESPAGSGIYLPYNTASAKYMKTGKHEVLDYRKNSFYTFIGFSLGANFKDRFHLLLSGAVSPYSTSESVDNHFKNNNGIGTDYKDIVNSVFKTFKGDFTASVDCNDTFTVCFNVGGLYSRLASGKSYYKSRGDGSSYKLSTDSDSGMAEHSFHMGLGLKIYIF